MWWMGNFPHLAWCKLEVLCCCLRWVLNLSSSIFYSVFFSFKNNSHWFNKRLLRMLQYQNKKTLLKNNSQMEPWALIPMIEALFLPFYCYFLNFLLTFCTNQFFFFIHKAIKFLVLQLAAMLGSGHCLNWFVNCWVLMLIKYFGNNMHPF